MEKGQFSIEFIVVLGALLIIISSVSLPLFNDSRESVGQIKDMTLARDAANKLAFSINAAYTEGLGAKYTVDFRLSEGIENIKIGDSEDYDNLMEVLISSRGWKDDNTVSVSTFLDRDNHPPVILENPENMMSQGKHNVRVKCELDPDPRIKIREV